MRSRLFALAALFALLPFTSRAQLWISEFLSNPGGADSPKEWVELIATENIDFSVTPYSVVWSDNTGTHFGTNGWSTGGNVTYGFDLIAGTVSRGDVFYVGGIGMAPTGIKSRTIDTGISGGDGGLGSAASGGVLGNGGSVADGIAVFDRAIANITSSLRPVDAIFFGASPTGNVFLTQYQLPVNDRYAGGAVDENAFLAPDPGGDDTIIGTGVFNPETGTWETVRDWALGTLSDGVSSITLTPVPEPSVIALLLVGIGAGALMRRRRRG